VCGAKKDSDIPEAWAMGEASRHMLQKVEQCQETGVAFQGVDQPGTRLVFERRHIWRHGYKLHLSVACIPIHLGKISSTLICNPGIKKSNVT
jgi:hypothetical protein